MATIVGTTKASETLTGGNDADTLIGGLGINHLYGGKGADIFASSPRLDKVNTDDSYDIIEDFEQGVDKIDVSAFGISSWTLMKVLLSSFQGNDAYFNAFYRTNTHSVHIKGIAFGDLKASDFIFSAASPGKITGSIGSDTLFGTTGDDIMDGVQRGAGGGAGPGDRLYGDAGNDTLIGRGSELFGGDGDDTLLGTRIGTDFMWGQAGTDSFKLSARDRAQYTYSEIRIGDFEFGVEKLDLSAFGISSFAQLKLIAEVGNGRDVYFNAFYYNNEHSFSFSDTKFSEIKASDFIFDSSGARTETGSEEKDRLFGSNSGDVLNGGGGNDQLFGGNGSDKLLGGAGVNDLYGQGGADVFKESYNGPSKSSDNIRDFEVGVDKIDISLFGISSFVQLQQILETRNGVHAYFNAFYSGRDHIVQIVNVAASKLIETDFIFDSRQNKNITGTDGTDLIFGSSTDDNLAGGEGNDVLIGDAGNDVLKGGVGNDTLSGGLGENDLYGDAGKDTFKMVERVAESDSNSYDTIYDFQTGSDKIDVSAFGISNFSQLLSISGSDDGFVYFNAYYFGEDHIIKVDNVPKGKLTAADFIFATGGAKTEIGSDFSDSLFGGAGADLLSGKGGDDYLFGGSGNDILVGGEGDNVLLGQGGVDVFTAMKPTAGSGFSNDDLISDFELGIDKMDVSAYGVSSFDQIQLIFNEDEYWAYFGLTYDGFGHSFLLSHVLAGQLKASDFIFDKSGSKNLMGTNHQDRLFGSTKADTLNGGGGYDELFGGDGNDRLINSDGADRLYGGNGTDTAVFTGNRSSYKVVVMADGSVKVGSETLIDIEKIQFADGTISTPQNLAPTTPSLSKASVLENATVGTTVGTFSAKDPEGGALTYKLIDSAGGLFKLSGSQLQVAKAIDYEQLQKDTIKIEVTDLADRKTIKTFTISVTDVVETKNGTSGDETLKGGIGADILNGRAGDDIVSGYAGRDVLIGGAGADKLYGGIDADHFVFKFVSESTASSRDTILDFSGTGGDRITLSGIDANTKVSGDQAFSFLGTAAFTGKAGELRYDKTSSNTYIYADINGDEKADFSIRLDDAVTLSKGYFVL